ncbi:hypothetical protein F5Y00DRAFT_182915 [Daldinia vernicosa]|uniref:uncharacterized protein n=1 Tax=Daldinia vernicosa TaxID=114800 RepID=UPI0020084F39|nr:uncharacterized protein F5Y00DRAFT_182915 [Daldinia vernicosa]KAI0844998.1 hypothetical protein F5Y00DRAFT_182915 [Daldinia vernicosa]
MSPTAETLEKDLRDGVRALVAERGWDQVTVNNVRQYVEDKGELEQGFFKAPEWEARSKKIIKEFVAQLLAEEDEAPSSSAANVKSEAKNGIKRQSSEEPSPSPKRQKKASRAAPSKRAKAKKEESESALSDLEDQSDFGEQPKKATKQRVAKKEESDSELSDLDSPEDEPKNAKPQKSISRRGAKKEETESELSDLDDSENEPKKKTKGIKKATPRRKTKKITKKEEAASDLEDSAAGKKRKRAAPAKKRNTKRAKAESDSEDDLSDEKKEVTKDEVESTADEKSLPQPRVNAKTESKAEESGEDTKLNVVDIKDNKDIKEADADDSGSDLSSVIDDPPPKKRKPREPKGAPKPKQAKELSADDTEIKKLQGQLLKCGVRKIWGIELKKYGDDSKAKIRHLKEMLRDIGIEGRFSEAKAKEIKEKRELMADLEAVTEMNRNWGSGAGRRASRSKTTKKTSKGESDEDQDAKDEEDEDEEVKGNPRVSKRMADLAFLGSDSESD